MSRYDYTDDVFWEELANSDVMELERVVGDIKAELAELETHRIVRRAEWDEYAAEQHPPEEYRNNLASYSRWRADAHLLTRAAQARKTQLITAMRNQVGAGGGPSARTLIHRLANTVRRFETDPAMSKEDLCSILDKTFLVAQGKRLTMREFVEAGSPW